jgi:uncharacterized protein with GYD domain
MPFYLHQWSYKDQQIRSMLIRKENRARAEVVRTAVEAFGGTLHSFFYAMGTCDGVAISQFPDGKTALACLMSIFAEGRITSVRTTALFTPEEGLDAMALAGETILGG